MERHRTGEMSGGQSQRVALARGLVAHPEVLFADEPTGSLDSLNGELVMGLLTRAAREQGSTVILVTHEPRVAAYADREVIVRDGKVTSTEASLSVIRLGLRLTLGSGREAALRVLVTAAAVALGVGLLLAALAGVNGLHAQTDRGAWLDTSAQASPPTSSIRPALVAGEHRPVRQPGDRPRRRCRRRAERPGPAGAFPPAGTR